MLKLAVLEQRVDDHITICNERWRVLVKVNVGISIGIALLILMDFQKVINIIRLIV